MFDGREVGGAERTAVVVGPIKGDLAATTVRRVTHRVLSGVWEGAEAG
jgi:hypothetical protein